MLGAIVGDIIGSTYEFKAWKSCDFPLFPPGSSFTDDSVLTCAAALALLEADPGRRAAGGGGCPTAADYGRAMRLLGREYPEAGWGGRFYRWLDGHVVGPYGSFGNGSAMRVSAVAWVFETETEVLRAARESALPTHDHPEGVKGAEATALAVFLARKGGDKARIKAELSSRFGYDLDRRLDDIRPAYRFDETCQGSVPEALIAFLEAESYEVTIRNAVSLGGDADTLAAIAGAVAEAAFGAPPAELLEPALALLDERLYSILQRFFDRWRPTESPRLRSLRQHALSAAAVGAPSGLS